MQGVGHGLDIAGRLVEVNAEKDYYENIYKVLDWMRKKNAKGHKKLNGKRMEDESK